MSVSRYAWMIVMLRDAISVGTLVEALSIEATSWQRSVAGHPTSGTHVSSGAESTAPSDEQESMPGTSDSRLVESVTGTDQLGLYWDHTCAVRQPGVGDTTTKSRQRSRDKYLKSAMAHRTIPDCA